MDANHFLQKLSLESARFPDCQKVEYIVALTTPCEYIILFLNQK